MANDHKVKQDFENHTRLKKAVPLSLRALFAITALLVGGISFMSCESDKTGIKEKMAHEASYVKIIQQTNSLQS